MRKSRRILLVDDSETGQLLATAVLQRDGFRVDSARSSTEVLERLKVHAPDLILMDVQMPGQDGLSLTRQLKADPVTATIPIVAMTAGARVSDREKAIAAGCSGYISKPIDTRLLGDFVWGLIVAAEKTPTK